MPRWSRYNLLIPADRHGAYLFNTRTGALVGLTAERREQIERSELLDDDVFGFFAGQGFIVEEDVDELALVVARHDTARAAADAFSATIELTEACNFRCHYCYQAHAARHMDADVAARVAAYLAGKMRTVRHLHVNWFGGEPLLRLATLAALSERLAVDARDSGCRLTQFITTNGYLLTRETALHLVRLGIEHVQITLDGDEPAHDAARPLASGRGTYRRVLDGCVAAMTAGLGLMVRINVGRRNAGSVAALLDDLLAAGITPANAVIHAVRTVDHGNCETTTAAACLSNVEFAATWIGILREVAARGFGLPPLSPIPYNCPFDLQQTVMIGHDGVLRHCSSSDSRLAEIDAAGDEVGRTGLFDHVKARSPTDDAHCRACRYLPMCMGGCSYLRDLGQEACIPERHVLGDLVTLTARQERTRQERTMRRQSQ